MFLVQTTMCGNIKLNHPACIAVVVQSRAFANRTAIGIFAVDDVIDVGDADRRSGQEKESCIFICEPENGLDCLLRRVMCLVENDQVGFSAASGLEGFDNKHT